MYALALLLCSQVWVPVGTVQPVIIQPLPQTIVVQPQAIPLGIVPPSLVVVPDYTNPTFTGPVLIVRPQEFRPRPPFWRIGRAWSGFWGF